jgi:hypothetical protein
MSYKLNIILKGDKLEDDQAKIVSLLVNGGTYPEIQIITLIRKGIIYNHVSKLYSLLRLPKAVNALTVYAGRNGFDDNFQFEGKAVLDSAEMNRLCTKVPRLLNK